MMQSTSLLTSLTQQNLLSPAQATEAAHLSKEWKTSLPRTLLAMGVLNGLTIYRALAENLQLPFVDLHKHAPDEALLEYSQREHYHRWMVIPWKQQDGVTYLACSEPSAMLSHWANHHYGIGHYALVITSPHDIQEMLSHHFAQEDDALAREHLWQYAPDSSAKQLLASWSWTDWWIPLTLIMLSFYASPHYSLLGVLAVANLFYITALSVKLGLFLIGRKAFCNAAASQSITKRKQSELPVYTLLVPLYKETAILKKLTNALLALDYPKAKLDIKLIVENDDTLTIEAIKALKCRRIFEIIKVPYSLPRTKPKACNYALQFARGEYVTIYDAEDVPDPQQLKKALWTFEQSDENTVCVQARLNYFNRKENWLTQLFSLEYAGLFDFLLWGVEKLNIPIPLGGTSNHFKIEALRTLYAWDPYNVTEDADLGIRIAKHGWKVTVMDSLTLEEAPITLGAWIRQRSRWIKGHLQTYLVHMRKPLALWKRLGTLGFFGFQFFLGAPCLIFIISPILLLLWAIGMSGLLPVSDTVELPAFFAWVLPVSSSIFAIGIITQALFALWVVMTRKWYDMWFAVLLFPFYWILHSIASFRALWQLFHRPHYWEKTDHGITRVESDDMLEQQPE